jgi:hypothetical protein
VDILVVVDSLDDIKKLFFGNIRTQNETLYAYADLPAAFHGAALVGHVAAALAGPHDRKRRDDASPGGRLHLLHQRFLHRIGDIFTV